MTSSCYIAFAKTPEKIISDYSDLHFTEEWKKLSIRFYHPFFSTTNCPYRTLLIYTDIHSADNAVIRSRFSIPKATPALRLAAIAEEEIYRVMVENAPQGIHDKHSNNLVSLSKSLGIIRTNAINCCGSEILDEIHSAIAQPFKNNR